MNCVKCGREISEDQVFCEICLTEMENYPVKPGTAVHIPPRSPEEELPKKTVKRKHAPTMEEMLIRTKTKLRRTRIFAALLLLLCGGLGFLMAQAVLELDFQRLLGQNYRTEEGKPDIRPVSEWTQLITEPSEAESRIPAATAENVTEPTAAPNPVPEYTERPAYAPTEPATEPATQPPTELPTEAPTEVPVPPTEVTEPAPPVTEVPPEPTQPGSDEPASQELDEPPAN